MTNDAKEVLYDFLKSEFSYEEMQKDIYAFVLSENIRSGEYVGNQYVLKKIDFYNFLIFEEYIDRNEVDISRYKLSLFSKKELKDAMERYLSTGDYSFVLTD